MKPAAVLLAGGLARRMGGGDKPLRLLGGRPILAHVVDRIASQVSAMAINANGDPSRFASFDLPVMPDDLPDTPGPLAGIHAGMEWTLKTHPGAPDILSIPTDLPLLPADLVARLEAARTAEIAEIAVATSGGHAHPVVALWPVRLAEELRHAIAVEGISRVTDFQKRYRVAYADFPVAAVDPFLNVNTPEDLAWAETLLR